MRALPYFPLVGLAECIEANLRVARLTSPEVRFVGIALNTNKLGEDEARRLLEATGVEHGLPCTDPFRFGADPIIDNLLDSQCAAALTPAMTASR
jgi:uncharacterized NAD-dependent epimerase/dehydratase family protein